MDEVDRRAIGFGAWRAPILVMPLAHAHTDIELNFLLRGTARYFLADGFLALPPRRLVTFWAGTPHRLVAVSPEAEYLCLVLPLGWFLSWGIGGVADRLLRGEAFIGSEADAALDEALFRRWAAELGHTPSPEATRIALLELEARLRRFARVAPGPPRVVDSDTAARLAALVGQRYTDNALQVRTLAEELGLHPNYANTVFKQTTGLPLWEYVLRLRVSHAQRLLLTTELSIEAIARESGFSSSSRFYVAFQRLVETTPRTFRQGRRLSD
jgi:AraC family transcriptional regulator, melibiose operon regulatory protein